ncbi:MAG: acyl carrier protein [Egibacteraceae bacterium]
MNEGSVYDRVKAITVEELGVDEDEVMLKAHFIDDLGADALDCTELVLRYEEEFSIEIPDVGAEGMATVGDVVNYIQQHAT